MNKYLFLPAVLFLLSYKTPERKYFTGVLEYAYTYSSDSWNADSLTKTKPSKGIFRYDTLNYQSKFTGRDTSTNYYSSVLNRCLSRTDHLADYMCYDYSNNTDDVISFRILETNEKTLGYSCKILEMQKRNSWLQYHISNDLKIAPATYNRHVAYNWDFYGEKASGGLILRSEHRFKYFTMKGIAISISPGDNNFKALEIDEKLFSQFCK